MYILNISIKCTTLANEADQKLLKSIPTKSISCFASPSNWEANLWTFPSY